MRFSSVALAATVSAAAVAAPAANLVAVGTSKNNFFDLTKATDGVKKDTPDFTWAKGYGAGFGEASSYVEVALDGKADAEVTFSAVYTGDIGTEAQSADTCKTIPTAQALPTIAATTGVTADETTAMNAAIKTNKVYLAVTWSGNLWQATDKVDAVEGTGTALAVKTPVANTAAVNADTAKSTCTSSVGFTIPKDAKNVAVTAAKDKGLTMGDATSYATVKALQAKKEGCANDVGKNCDPADSTDVLAGGLGVYQAIKGTSGSGFLWAVNIKAATEGSGDGTSDSKKSATTLAIGAAAGLVAAAIA